MQQGNYDILVVEDEQVVLAAVRRIVETEKLRMDEALTGDIALSKLRRQSYKLILTDLMLPRISGLDLIPAIKQDHPCVPVVVMTGYATLEKALQSFLMGTFDFIPKPFDTEHFLATITRGIYYGSIMQQRGPDEHAYIPLPESEKAQPGEEVIYCLGCHSHIKMLADGTALVRVGETFVNMIAGLAALEAVGSRDELNQGRCCAQFLADNGLVHRLWAPLSGRIIAFNEELTKDVNLIDKDPYGGGWIFKIRPTNLKEELGFLKVCRRGALYPKNKDSEDPKS